jgi:hypothetical protein
VAARSGEASSVTECGGQAIGRRQVLGQEAPRAQSERRLSAQPVAAVGADFRGIWCHVDLPVLHSFAHNQYSVKTTRKLRLLPVLSPNPNLNLSPNPNLHPPPALLHASDLPVPLGKVERNRRTSAIELVADSRRLRQPLEERLKLRDEGERLAVSLQLLMIEHGGHT